MACSLTLAPLARFARRWGKARPDHPISGTSACRTSLALKLVAVRLLGTADFYARAKLHCRSCPAGCEPRLAVVPRCQCNATHLGSHPAGHERQCSLALA